MNSELIDICDRLTCQELVIILSGDATWTLPRGSRHAGLRMAEARAAIRYHELEDQPRRRQYRDERKAA